MPELPKVVHRLNEFFPRSKHVVLPVIHVRSLDQTLRNSEVAFSAGCDGVFLINHGPSWSVLLRIAHQVNRTFPQAWIGVNCLDLSVEEVFERVDNTISGVWVDNAMVDERQEAQDQAAQINAIRQRARWKGLYFGGVAFKCQRTVNDLNRAARTAARYMDVVTTSGPGTGRAASVEKIATMKSALDGLPLAIASGITPENVRDYLPLADCFLVATGISRDFHELDESRVKQLAVAVRNFSATGRPDRSNQ